MMALIGAVKISEIDRSPLAMPEIRSHVRVVAVKELQGCNFGIQVYNRPEIFVSPAVFTLIKSDEESMINALTIKEGKLKDYPYLKKYRHKKQAPTL